jgi:hypothetical protein
MISGDQQSSLFFSVSVGQRRSIGSFSSCDLKSDFIVINKRRRTIDPTGSIRHHSIAKQLERRFGSSTMNDKFNRLSIGEKNLKSNCFLTKTLHLTHSQRTDVNIDLTSPIVPSNLIEEIRFFVIPLDIVDRVNLILDPLGNKGIRSNRGKAMKIQQSEQ